MLELGFERRRTINFKPEFVTMTLYVSFFSSPEDIFPLLLERGEGRQGGRETSV